MPTVMAMDGDDHSRAVAPLDLSTTQRGNTSSTTAPQCGGCPREAVRSPVSPSPPSRKRPADRASLRLPFRKRPYPVEPEERGSGEAGQEEGLSRVLEADAPHRERETSPLAGTPENRLAPVNLMQAEEAPWATDTCPVHIVPTFTYGHYPVYHYHELGHLGFHPTQNLLASVALATRQDEDGDTALHIAVVQGELAMVRQLIHLLQYAGRSLDVFNNLRQTPLHLAVITQQISIVEALLRAGSDPSALDRNGQTALHLCCEYNHPECLSAVLSLPSSAVCLDMKNFQGLSPLHLAVLHAHINLVSMLLGAGADINTMDIKSGQSPLILAVESNNAEMVHFLIESGCDVNRPSYSGNTALHSACARGQADLVRALLKNGADSSVKNYHNDTPVMLAKNKKIADILRGKGSKPMRVPDQHIGAATSPRSSNFPANGSPSSGHSRGCSPSTIPHRAALHSPRSPGAFPFY
ncbi:B-cell lymphoma 3 protein homolog [Corythoichthys intestinalis]|uniref:B-cell lymphoma 3 protein homolog n=1 Tax=Corythoichthys intestinalis TaxID=161448 RepID=UPI0025A5B253|nr:B-cell lymphoma 3 protein homolog [Corythoichthys intestinalis]XP_061788888.1 B-cell lymphoma 3 protein homolog [Nerophis lumbriciformis]